MTDVPIDNIVPFNDGQVRWADGFINLLAGLGVQGRDKFASQTFTHSPLPLNELENAYRSDWIARKVVTIPAWDMTREWRSWQADPDQIELLEAVEQKLFIQMKLQQALIKARLYGGACIIIGVDAGAPEEELDLEEVGQDTLKFIHVVSRQQLRAGPIIRDISSKYFGQPEFYEAANEPAPKNFQQEPEEGSKPLKAFANRNVKLHPSRVVKLIGMDTADQMLMDIWGDSVLQAVNDAVKMCGLVTGSLATLVAELKVDVIKIPELKSILSTAAGERKMLARFSAANAAKSVINTIMIDGNEEWQRIQASLTGVPETLMAYMQIAAGAADIPATRFLGMSPSGLNATGESDIRNYYDRLAAEQETILTPTMTILDEVLIRSALGDRPPEVWYEWKSLWQHSDAEKAELALKKAQAYKIDVDAAQLPVTALANARANQLIEDGTYPGLEAALEEAALEGDTIEEANAEPEMTPEMEAMQGLPPPGQPGGPPPGAGQVPGKPPPKPPMGGNVLVMKPKKGKNPFGDREYVRVPGGQPGGGQFGHGGGGDIAEIRPPDSDPSKPWPGEDDGTAKAGDEILVFRLQSANSDLAGTNAGDVNAVANHLTNIDDYEKPAFKGGSGDTIGAYQVKLTADPGKYDPMIEGGKSAYGRAAENPDSVGRSTKRGSNDYVENAYSFPKSGGGYERRKLDSVPLSAVRGKLKEMGYHSADDAGTLKTSQAIRTVFNERTRRRDSAPLADYVTDYNTTHVPAGSSEGGQFGTSRGGGRGGKGKGGKTAKGEGSKPEKSPAEKQAAKEKKKEKLGQKIRELEAQRNQGTPAERAAKQAELDKLKEQLAKAEGRGESKGKGGGKGGGGGKEKKEKGEKKGKSEGGGKGEKGGGGKGEKGGAKKPPSPQKSSFKAQEKKKGGGGSSSSSKGGEGEKFQISTGKPGGMAGQLAKQTEEKAKELGKPPIDPKLKEEERKRRREKRDSLPTLFNFDVSRETSDREYCHQPGGQPTGGQFTGCGEGGGGAEGGKEPHEGKEVEGYSTGEKAAGDDKDIKDTKNGWYDKNPHDTVPEALRGAQEAQERLGPIGERIAQETGAKFKDPGIKADLDRIQEKADERGGANRVSDLFRGGFEISKPEQADAIAKALAKEYATANENWKPTPAGYTDKAVSIRDKNGMVGEIQIADKNMWEAKNAGGGHNMYKEAQKLESGIKSGKLSGRNADLARDRIGSLNQGMKDVYAEAKSRSGREWDKVYKR